MLKLVCGLLKMVSGLLNSAAKQRQANPVKLRQPVM
jgi:hypothetical protein